MELGIQCVIRILFLILVSINRIHNLLNNNFLTVLIVLTDTDFKSNAAYSFLKELQREVYKEVPSFQNNYDTITNLNTISSAVANQIILGNNTKKKDNNPKK